MKIVFCCNNLLGFYLFRKDIAQHYADKGFGILVIYPSSCYDKSICESLSKFCRLIGVEMLPNTISPISDYGYFKQLLSIFKREKPDIVINYTIKPNIYGAFAARCQGIRSIDMVAGLGNMFSGNSLKKKMARFFYRFGLMSAGKVIVLNEANYNELADKYVRRDKLVLFPGGEGINLNDYPYRKNTFDSTTFLMISRLLYDKGYQEFVDAARVVRSRYPDVKFELLGGFSENNPNGVENEVLSAHITEGVIDYLGETKDVPSYVLRDGIVVVLPSYYHEGMNRSLMEAVSMGRPIITTNVPGCRELVEDGINGYCVEPGDSNALAAACIRFFQLKKAEKEMMSRASYEKCKKQFDVRLVIKRYDSLLFPEKQS